MKNTEFTSLIVQIKQVFVNIVFLKLFIVYIPHSSDKTGVEGALVYAIMKFTSLIVQIKRCLGVVCSQMDPRLHPRIWSN